jgi:hypothetical protein
MMCRTYPAQVLYPGSSAEGGINFPVVNLEERVGVAIGHHAFGISFPERRLQSTGDVVMMAGNGGHIDAIPNQDLHHTVPHQLASGLERDRTDSGDLADLALLKGSSAQGGCIDPETVHHGRTSRRRTRLAADASGDQVHEGISEILITTPHIVCLLGLSSPPKQDIGPLVQRGQALQPGLFGELHLDPHATFWKLDESERAPAKRSFATSFGVLSGPRPLTHAGGMAIEVSE